MERCGAHFNTSDGTLNEGLDRVADSRQVRVIASGNVDLSKQVMATMTAILFQMVLHLKLFQLEVQSLTTFIS
jgi:hypothetical protein